jgi:hypothetical protein
MGDEVNFCRSIRKGDILKVPQGFPMGRLNSSKVLVIDVLDRYPDRPLLTIVTEHLKIENFDSGWFYIAPEPKELTVAEISEKLGYEVKVVK